MKVQRSPICYKTGRNYFKGKMLVIYELKTKSTGEGRLRNYGLSYPCHNSNSGISTQTTANVSLMLSMTV